MKTHHEPTIQHLPPHLLHGVGRGTALGSVRTTGAALWLCGLRVAVVRGGIGFRVGAVGGRRGGCETRCALVLDLARDRSCGGSGSSDRRRQKKKSKGWWVAGRPRE
jgi:hypothetical protein